ncbi:hypothetical protein [Aquabacterium sp.]|uniref:hypothetical protein n=1 Tax=Aquabacterium sp. TaxID=1872578 RepID=UPI002C2DEABC|nr:hypothetical protein [Aquabacterium sp.]HSW05849.1 hypothetical protein [Aquabacterium sp.]
MLAPPPRHFLSAPQRGAPPSMQPASQDDWLSDAGMPQERLARIAARRSFVEIKQRFIDAVADVAGPRGHWLRHQVRQTQEPVDLWLLRGAVFAALRGQDENTYHLRLDLHRALDSVFPDSGELTPFMPLT